MPCDRVIVVTLPYTGTHWILELLSNIGVPWVHYHPGIISEHKWANEDQRTGGLIPRKYDGRTAIATLRPEADQLASIKRRHYGKVPDGFAAWDTLKAICDRLNTFWVNLYEPDYGGLLGHLGLLPPKDLNRGLR